MQSFYILPIILPQFKVGYVYVWSNSGLFPILPPVCFGFLFVFICKAAVRQKETKRHLSSGSFPKCSQQPGLGHTQARSPELSLPREWWGPKYLSYLLPPRLHSSVGCRHPKQQPLTPNPRVRLEVEPFGKDWKAVHLGQQVLYGKEYIL